MKMPKEDTDPELIEIERFGGGEMKHQPRPHIGGCTEFKHKWNVDEDRLTEISSTLKDSGGDLTFWCQLPNSDRDSELFPVPDAYYYKERTMKPWWMLLVSFGYRVYVINTNHSRQFTDGHNLGSGECSSKTSDDDIKKSIAQHEKKRKLVGQSDKNKRVKVLGNENLPMKKDFKYFKSMYPNLTRSLELETLAKMPLPKKKDLVTDFINSIGMEKANELDKQWANFFLMATELLAKKLDMTSKLIKVIVEEMRR